MSPNPNITINRPLAHQAKIIRIIQSKFPTVFAIYAFGSQIQGTATAQSDLDLALLVPTYADPLELWECANKLANLVKCEVDLLDLRAASTVMQYQVIMHGERIWGDELNAGLFETFVMAEKLHIDERRTELLDDIPKRVSIYVHDKVAVIERCLKRVQEEYLAADDNFATDFTRQDAAILNIQRACEAALDMGQHLIRRDKLGLPQSSRDVFELLAKNGYISELIAASMQKMVGFRNIAVHEYQRLLLPITISVITEHLDEFSDYCSEIITKKVND